MSAATASPLAESTFATGLGRRPFKPRDDRGGVQVGALGVEVRVILRIERLHFFLAQRVELVGHACS